MTNPSAEASFTGPGLYVHIPFCRRICPYCDFAVTVGSAAAAPAFTEHVVREIELHNSSGPFDTLYFGGGTPSALPLAELSRIVDALEAHRWLADDRWMLLEANPEDVTTESLSGWRSLGIRTLSLGVQSLKDDSLAFLGRRHSAAEGSRSVRTAREAGFETVSLDLMYGLPGQNADEWREELVAAAELGADHISCYQLTIHEETPFGRRKSRGDLLEAPEKIQAALFRASHEVLAELGYQAYEVSSFAREPEHRSKHNPKYWDHTRYLGLGPSAHSFDGRTRSWNEWHLSTWQETIDGGRVPIASTERLDDEALMLEMLMLGLRTSEGVDFAAMKRRFGVDLLRNNGALVERLDAEGLVLLDGQQLRPTLSGLAVADSLAAGFEIEVR